MQVRRTYWPVRARRSSRTVRDVGPAAGSRDGRALCWYRGRADITYDGSSTSVPTAVLRRQRTWLIDESAGVQRGGNLFHGFGALRPRAGETAFFHSTPPDCTGPDRARDRASERRRPFSIYGTIESDYTADLYLLNPAGVIFGAGARLDLRQERAFTASTANVLRLGPSASRSPWDSSDSFPLLAVGRRARSDSSRRSARGDPRSRMRSSPGRFGTARSRSSAAVWKWSAPWSLHPRQTCSPRPCAPVRFGSTPRDMPDVPRFDLSGVLLGGIDPAAQRHPELERDRSGGPRHSARPSPSPEPGMSRSAAAICSASTRTSSPTPTGTRTGATSTSSSTAMLELERRTIQGAGIYAFSQLPQPRDSPAVGQLGRHPHPRAA